MAVTINSNATDGQNPTTAPVSEATHSTQEPPLTAGGAEFNSNDTIQSLSAAEMNDPNSITVNVSDHSAPLVVLFGPPASGKTMTLVRLTRYLKGQGYSVGPIRTFRPYTDTNYSDICDNFNAMINNDNAAESTNRINFMLVEVIKNGRRLCQILEAPGEYYFHPDTPNAPFPNYVNTIISSQNRKIWTIMVEPDWLNLTDRRNYVNKIVNLKRSMRSKDRVVFVFNKIDKTNFVRSVGSVNVQSAIKEVRDLYPGIFTNFINQNPITKLWRSYDCDFVPFQTGTYTASLRGMTYQEGPEEYCVKLWQTLLHKIYG